MHFDEFITASEDGIIRKWNLEDEDLFLKG
jgi:hypothetical protein